MKKALSEILKITTPDDKIIHISIVQKQSDLGLSTNKRLFLLIENYSFGYISQFKQSQDPRNIDITKCKVIVPIRNLTKDPERTKDTIALHFYVNQNGKRVNKKWILSMATQNLAIQWQALFASERSKSATRKSPSATKRNQDASPNKNVINENQINKNNQVPKNVLQPRPRIIQPEKPNSQVNQNYKKIRQSIDKDFKLDKNRDKSPKEFTNQLYETLHKKDGNDDNFIIQEPTQHQKVAIAKKLSYGEQTEFKKQQHQEKWRAQQLRRQKEQLSRKERQLREKEQKIRLQQQKIEKQRRKIRQQQQIYQRSRMLAKKQVSQVNVGKGPKNQNQKQVTIISQKFFHKKQTIQRVSQPNEIEKTTEKNLKQNNKNYEQMISKIIAQEQNDIVQESKQMSNSRNKQLEEAHSYLLQLQKLKLGNNKLHNQSALESEKENKENPIPIQYGWTFRFLVNEISGNEDSIIKQFNSFCSRLLKQVVEQLHLPQRKRKYLPKYRRQQYFLYVKQDIQFKIAFTEIKQIFSKDQPRNRDTICDQKNIKKLQNEFKSFQLLYHASKQCSTRVLRVPLCCLCQYQGFVAFFKASSQFEGQKTNLDKRVTLDLQNLSEKIKININNLREKNNILILKLNGDFYRQLASRTGNIYTKFDLFMIEEIKHLIPTDDLFSRHLSQQNFNSGISSQKQENTFCLRSELIINYSYRPESNQIKGTMIFDYLRKNHIFKSSKISSVQNEKTELQKLSQNVLIPITELIKQLDNLQIYFLHPTQLSSKFHSMGINIRYLGLVYEHSNLQFTKSYIMSEMAARASKALFRKTFQDIQLEQNQQLTKQSSVDEMRFKAIDFLNCVLGTTIETTEIWKILSTYSTNYYNMGLEQTQIQKGYFVNSLIYHCGIDVDITKIHINDTFSTNQFFNEDNLLGVKVRLKSYEPIFSQQQKDLIARIELEDPEVFKIMQNQYKIQSRQLPDKFRHSIYWDKIRKYLVNFIAPDFGYKHLNLYNDENFITKTDFYVKLMQLKWHLRRQRKQKYISAFNNINEEIINAHGDFHPLLSQLYDTMCIYYKNNGQYEDAITFSKSSVINMLKVCGTNHPKVGECYYQMATCCIKAGKKQQAIISLQKAKNIFQMNEGENNVAYAHVCLKLGLLFLNQGKVQQAENIAKYALSIFNKSLNLELQNQEQLYEQERIECYQIMLRCYQLQQSKDKQLSLSLDCQKQMKYLKGPNNLQKLLKVILYPILSSLPSGDASIYLDIISLLPLEISVNTYVKGYDKIYQRIAEGTFIQILQKYLQNLKTLSKFITQNNSLQQWKGLTQTYERQTVNDFIALTEEMIYFLGEGFVTGSIRDNV